MAIDVKAWAPRVTSPAVRFVRMSGPALHFGVKEHAIHGATLKVYPVAKTVTDCFKLRTKIGIDIALEALRECRRLDSHGRALGSRQSLPRSEHHASVSGVALIARHEDQKPSRFDPAKTASILR